MLQLCNKAQGDARRKTKRKILLDFHFAGLKYLLSIQLNRLDDDIMIKKLSQLESVNNQA